jgi:hypothetical protein
MDGGCRPIILVKSGELKSAWIVSNWRSYQAVSNTLDTLARGMESRELTNQYSFHTERAIALLTVKGL